MTHRPPPHGAAGPAGGALSGMYPSPAHGSPSASGYGYRDEYIRPPVSMGGTVYVGDRLWQLITIGSAPTAANVIPTAPTEIGVTALSTAAAPALGEGGSLAHNGASIVGAPVAGSILDVKIRLDPATATNSVCWSGLIGSPALRPSGAVVVDFVGFRGVAGANWFFVCRSGAVETTLDMGLTVDADWRIFGFRRLLDDSIEAVVGDCANGWRGPRWASVGTIATNIPGGAMQPLPLGIATLAAGVKKSAQIDWWEMGGAAERSV